MYETILKLQDDNENLKEVVALMKSQSEHSI
jgi:hypothetical protein